MRIRKPRNGSSDTQTESPEFQRFLLESVLDLDKRNPSFPLAGTLPGPPLSDGAAWLDALPEMEALTRRWAPLVGRLEYRAANGQPVAIGTAFRIPGPKPRALTARHVLPHILPPDCAVTGDYPFTLAPAGASHRPLRLVLDSGTVDARVRWCHRTFDLLLLDLDDPGGLLPDGPDIRPPRHNERIAVIGHPLGGGDIAVAGKGVFGPSSLNRKHVSPGHVSATGIPAGMHYHLASTLPGFSGAPVIALSDNALLGVHVWGSSSAYREGWLNDLCGLAYILGDDADFRTAVLGSDDPPGLHATGPVTLDLSGLATESRLQRLDLEADELRDEPLLASLVQDRPDFRDLPYVPGLRRPRSAVLPRGRIHIRDQAGLPYCAACALAAVIERQLSDGTRVNVRMLHENARLQDEWVIPGLRGTSLRGVLKGFFHNGVCLEGAGGRIEADPHWVLTRERAKEARTCVLGAYFRLGRSVTDLQMAVQETGSVLMAARIHKGWIKPDDEGRIQPDPQEIGQHAFAVTGYTAEGFVVQNSWGKGWSTFGGREGHALWSYRDWADSMIDAWTLRLAPSSASAFNLVARDMADSRPMPRRSQLIGHVVSIEADRILTSGALAMGVLPLLETVSFLKSKDFDASYDALLLVHHDPFPGNEAVARIAGLMTERLKQARIYPLHILFGFDEIATWALRLRTEAGRVAAAFAGSGIDAADYLERRAAPFVEQALASLAPLLRKSAKSGPLRQVLDLLTGPGLPRTMVLAAGSGCLIAQATAAPKRQPPPERNFWLMPTIRGPGGCTVLRLGADEQAATIPGYKGDWPDLVASAAGMAGKPRNLIRGRTTLPGRDLYEALTGSDLMARLAKAAQAYPGV